MDIKTTEIAGDMASGAISVVSKVMPLKEDISRKIGPMLARLNEHGGLIEILKSDPVTKLVQRGTEAVTGIVMNMHRDMYENCEGYADYMHDKIEEYKDKLEDGNLSILDLAKAAFVSMGVNADPSRDGAELVSLESSVSELDPDAETSERTESSYGITCHDVPAISEQHETPESSGMECGI